MAYAYGTDFADSMWQDYSSANNGTPTAGNDYIYGFDGNDYLDGSSGDDTIYGGTGVDALYGGISNDWFDFDTDVFAFNTTDSGDKFVGQADTIYDFTDGNDDIKLNGYYTDAGDTLTPADGQYGISQDGSNWVVTWNAFNDDGYHDVIVQGGDPHGDVKTWYDDVIIW